MVADILKKYPKDVQVVFKNFPLSFHRQAKTAAKYALAAHEQGKWYEMYEMIMKDFRELKKNEKLPKKYAKELGLDMDKFMADFNSSKVAAQVDLEINQLKKSDIPRHSVPKFLIQGREVPPGYKRSLESYSAMIDEELQKLKK